MFRDSYNIIPASLAVLLHVLILGSMIAVYDLARPTPFTPLAVQATLVTEIPEVTPSRVLESPSQSLNPLSKNLNRSRSPTTAKNCAARPRKRSAGSTRCSKRSASRRFVSRKRPSAKRKKRMKQSAGNARKKKRKGSASRPRNSARKTSAGSARKTSGCGAKWRRSSARTRSKRNRNGSRP